MTMKSKIIEACKKTLIEYQESRHSSLNCHLCEVVNFDCWLCPNTVFKKDFDIAQHYKVPCKIRLGCKLDYFNSSFLHANCSSGQHTAHPMFWERAIPKLEKIPEMYFENIRENKGVFSFLLDIDKAIFDELMNKLNQ